jgi:hypothetical protein
LWLAASDKWFEVRLVRCKWLVFRGKW